MTATFLRPLALYAAVSVLALAAPVHAQGDDDAQIRRVIGVYFRGHATANAYTMRAAFLPTAHIEGIRNGVFASWTVDQYVARFRGTPAPDEATRLRTIDLVDRSGNAAMVKVNPDTSGPDGKAIPHSWTIARLTSISLPRGSDRGFGVGFVDARRSCPTAHAKPAERNPAQRRPRAHTR